MSAAMKQLIEDLLQMVLTAFYEDSDFCVMDILNTTNEKNPLSPCKYIYDDDSNAINIQINKKMEQMTVRKILNKLKCAGIVAVETYKDPNRPGSKPCLYYYFDRQHFFFSTLYRVHRFNEQLKKMSVANTNQLGVLKVCPNHLDKKYDPLECISMQDLHHDRLARCHLCQQELINVQSSKTDRTTTRKAAFTKAQEDIKEILGTLRQIYNGYKQGERLTTLRPSDFLRKIYDDGRIRREHEKRQRKIAKGMMNEEDDDDIDGSGATAGYNDASAAFSRTSRGLNAQGQEFGVRFDDERPNEGEEGAGADGSSSSSTSSSSTGNRKRGREDEEDEEAGEERDAKGLALPAHFRTGGVGGGGGAGEDEGKQKRQKLDINGVDEEEDGNGDDALVNSSSKRLKKVTNEVVVGKTEIVVEEEDMGEKEENDKDMTTMVMVGGVSKLLDDVTDDDQEKMSDKEREIYRGLMQDDDDDDDY